MKVKIEKHSRFFCLPTNWKLVMVVLMVASLCATAHAQTTVLTYQGKLNDGGVAANSSYDMQFKLFDASSAGTQIGTVQTVTNVATAGGIFTVEIDFGVPSFPGADRFIEIGVSRAGQNNFTTLAPRQKLNSAPYSIHASSSTTAAIANNALQLNGIPANQYVLTNDTRLDANNYVQNTTTPQSSVNFNIGGTGTASVLEAGVQFNLGGSRILSSVGTSNLFAGVGAGAGNTTGDSNSFFGANTGKANTTGALNSYFGTSAGLSTTSGGFNSSFGFEAGQSNTTSSGNSFFGNRAGRLSTSGGNSFFGNIAGTANTTGSFNTFLGASTGTNNTTGSNNTFIGADTDVSSSTNPQINNSTAIGFSARVSTSNTIVLGTSLETTRIPGKMITNKLIMGGGGLESGGVAQSFSSGANSGIFTGNIFLSGLDTLLASPVHLCTRSTNLGGFGGDGLARCSTAFSSKDNKIEEQPFAGGIEIIKRLKPIAFKWKDGGVDFGLNAEDVDAVAPEFVTRSDNGKIEDVKESSLSVLFINAFKEQQKQIEEQQKTIQTQRELNRQQQQQIDALKRLVCQTNAQAQICREK